MSQPGAVSWDKISPGYFETIGTHLSRGRSIDDRDQPSSQAVAVVNRTFANAYFKKRNPIGRRFGKDGPQHAADYEIVGMVEDAKYKDAYKPAYPTFFLPLMQLEIKPDGSLARSNYIRDIELYAGSRNNLELLVRRTTRKSIQISLYLRSLATESN